MINMNGIRRLPDGIAQFIDRFHVFLCDLCVLLWLIFLPGYSSFFLLSRITPIIATSRSTETISNGRV